MLRYFHDLISLPAFILAFEELVILELLLLVLSGRGGRWVTAIKKACTNYTSVITDQVGCYEEGMTWDTAGVRDVR